MANLRVDQLIIHLIKSDGGVSVRPIRLKEMDRTWIGDIGA